MLNVLILFVGAGVAAAALAVRRLARSLDRQRQDAIVQQQLTTFAPALAAVRQDPKELLVWYPLAQASRRLFPEAFAALDRAFGGTFPFTKEQLQAAHAKWSADWLAWERAHDAECSLKAAEVQNEIDRSGHSAAQASPLLRTRLAAVEQQKLERYQQRYEEYIKTAKALAAFVE
ncbi:MAG: hypothetical protein ND807_02875 [Vicinamibacterales bacterium]|nr:hypothetical protein [Vicinamibacterales bacterium]